MQAPLWLWIAFNAFVLGMLALDLGLFHRKAHAISTREAALWSAVWIGLALAFGYGVYHFVGARAGLEFLTGYLIEKSLSVDNIFVFVLIFSYFGVPEKYQHRVLFWGILGALVMRGAMIAAGAMLLERFDWILYLFGAFLVVTGIRMAVHDDSRIEPESSPVLRVARRFLPVTESYHGQKFFVSARAGRTGRSTLMVTPLLLVLLFVETTDLLFAVDSIPAVFAVTRDPFLVYTSNIFAILGLRSLYFLLASIIHRFHFLKMGLAVVLSFVGVKMLLDSVYHIPVVLSLAMVGSVLTLAVAASLVFPRTAPAPAAVAPDGRELHARAGETHQPVLPH